MIRREFFAHKGHPLANHLNDVGSKAEQFAAAFDSSIHAKIAGLLHDLGKAEIEFQKRLASDDEEGEKQPHAHHGGNARLGS